MRIAGALRSPLWPCHNKPSQDPFTLGPTRSFSIWKKIFVFLYVGYLLQTTCASTNGKYKAWNYPGGDPLLSFFFSKPLYVQGWLFFHPRFGEVIGYYIDRTDARTPSLFDTCTCTLSRWRVVHPRWTFHTPELDFSSQLGPMVRASRAPTVPLDKHTHPSPPFFFHSPLYMW